MTITTIIGCTNQPYNTTVYITQPCSADFSMLVISPQLRLAEHLTPLRAWCTSDVCLVGEIPTCSVPALERCDGLWAYNYDHDDNEYTPPPCWADFPMLVILSTVGIYCVGAKKIGVANISRRELSEDVLYRSVLAPLIWLSNNRVWKTTPGGKGVI